MTKSRILFYPGSGMDFEPPLRKFCRHVDELWFVDNDPARLRRRVKLPGFAQVESIEFAITDFKSSGVRHRLAPNDEGTPIDVVFLAADAISAFDYLFHPNSDYLLSILFHRRDSQDEGGSGINWLASDDQYGAYKSSTLFLEKVLAQLEPNGLLVTDGSNADKEFQTFFDNPVAPKDAHLHCDAFVAFGRRLEPIATLGMKNGPTIVWQVR